MVEYTDHIPVMLKEVLHYLALQDNDVVVDGTFGAGGYTKGILESSSTCKVVALDRDPSVKDKADAIKKQFDGRFQFIQGNFGDMKDLVREETRQHQVDGIVLDIGVSSMQIDQADRGFSFMKPGPLDMRMSQQGRSAADFINTAAEEEIANVIYQYGGERRSRAVARAIVRKREEEPIETTTQLADIVRSVVRKAKDNIDPSTRTFQAIRIWINDELGELERALEAAESLLKVGGRLVVVTFHSLEDSIVKRFLKDRSGKGSQGVSRHIPVVVQEEEDSVKTFKVLTKKPVAASDEETKHNVRARSAKLRAAVKVAEVRAA